MKTYEEYCKEYEKIVNDGKKKGHNMAVRLDFYVAIHFLEDNGITEPWADDAPDKLKKALDKCSPADYHRFMFVINTALSTIAGKDKENDHEI